MEEVSNYLGCTDRHRDGYICPVVRSGQRHRQRAAIRRYADCARDPERQNCRPSERDSAYVMDRATR